MPKVAKQPGETKIYAEYVDIVLTTEYHCRMYYRGPNDAEVWEDITV